MNGKSLSDKIDGYLATLRQTADKRQAVPPLQPGEKQERLRRFHPDYIDDMFTAMPAGINKGQKVVKEFADLITSPGIVENAVIDKSVSFDTDVLVIGGGGAGITAAIFAHDSGAKVTLVTKLRLGDSNTIMAQGGMQVSIGKDDTPVQHFKDTMSGGGNVNDASLVRLLVEKGPESVAWLERIGTIFSTDESGDYALKKGGGASRSRLIYAKDYTGLEITRNLINELHKRDIKVVEFSPVAELLTGDNGECTGAVVIDYDNDHFFNIRAKTTIVATGGSGRLHIGGFPSSNHFGSTGDGTVIAYRAGAEITDMDSFQYHPTGVIYPSQMLGLLVTEAIRSEGGHLVNALGERFVNETETRDFVAASIIRECREGRGISIDDEHTGVWLDIPALDRERGGDFVRKRFPAMYRQFKRFGWDIRKKPVLVYPTLHYQNGGIKVDTKGETTVENLFAVGENVGGIHGKNRLMGNSLLELFVFGRIVGTEAAAKALKTTFGNTTLKHLGKIEFTNNSQSPLLLPDYIRKDF
jgi:succinate dehydrogenase / fumarate reductase flavoprotein subunit/L-aspartate oxidase